MKLVYPAKFYYEEDGGYSIEVPDLVGCNHTRVAKQKSRKS